MKRIVSHLLVLPLLVSICGLNLNFHLCQDKVQSFGIFVNAESCSPGCEDKPSSNEDGITKKNCCKDVGYSFWPQFTSPDADIHFTKGPSSSLLIPTQFVKFKTIIFEDFNLWKIPQYTIHESESKRILIQSFQI